MATEINIQLENILFIENLAEKSTATVSDECKTYQDGQKIYIGFNNQIIGYVIYRDIRESSTYPPKQGISNYWCGYAYVSDNLIQVAHHHYTNDDDDLGNSSFPLDLSVEITYVDKVIGWDHGHLKDQIDYTNLVDVAHEVYNVWKKAQEYNIKPTCASEN